MISVLLLSLDLHPGHSVHLRLFGCVQCHLDIFWKLGNTEQGHGQLSVFPEEETGRQPIDIHIRQRAGGKSMGCLLQQQGLENVAEFADREHWNSFFIKVGT